MSDETAERLRRELEHARAELRDARTRIAAMEASSFWKLRNAWWRVKGRLTGTPDSTLFAPLPPEQPEPARDPFETLAAEAALPRDERVAEGERLQADSRAAREALQAEGRALFGGRKVLFVLPVAERGGGANVVFAEARAMRRMGVDARVLNIPRLRDPFTAAYREPGVPVVWAEPERIPEAAAGFDAVVATANTSVPWIAPLAGRGPSLGYYVQDYEPLFYPSGSPEFARAKASYTLAPGLRLVTKTEWNRETLARETGAAAAVIGPSLDVDLFALALPAPPPAPLRVAAMIRPSSPRRGPERTMRVFAALAQELGDEVELFTFGVDGREPSYRRLAHFPHRHLGVLDETRLATLFGRIHVFADFSDYQAMGLTALEAMACGATAVVPRAGGADSFARDGENALVVDTESEEACAGALRLLATDRARLEGLCERAPATAAAFAPEAAALAMLQVLLGPTPDRR